MKAYPHQELPRMLLRKWREEFREKARWGWLPDWWVTLHSAETGTGKTYLAMALAADLCRMGIEALFVSEIAMMEEYRGAARPGSDFGAAQVRQGWRRPALLVLDDLTADKATEASARELYMLVEWRRRKRRPTLITTNKEPDGIAGHYGPDQGRRIASRIWGMCRGGESWMTMEGPDLRIEGEV